VTSALPCSAGIAGGVLQFFVSGSLLELDRSMTSGRSRCGRTRPPHRACELLAWPQMLGLTGDTACRPNVLALGDLPWVEQVELEFLGDAGDGGLAGLACGKSPPFLVLRGLARPGRSRTKVPGARIFSRNAASARSSWPGGESRDGVRRGGQGTGRADSCGRDARGDGACADDLA